MSPDRRQNHLRCRGKHLARAALSGGQPVVQVEAWPRRTDLRLTELDALAR
ncbi:MAG: hypothetical protein R3F62_04845 [Planctomycetota bacterium]